MGAPLNSLPTNVVPDTMQNLYDYQGGNFVIYAGYAKQGLANTSDGWIIFLYTYDGNNNVTSKQTWLGAWSQRTAGVYA